MAKYAWWTVHPLTLSRGERARQSLALSLGSRFVEGLHLSPHSLSLPTKGCSIPRGVDELQARGRQSSSHQPRAEGSS